MPNWSGIILTNKGRQLQAKVESGSTSLVLTKLKLGNGTISEGQSLEALNDLVAPKQVVGIATKTVLENGYCKIAATISNNNLAEGYLVKELGVFATDPDEGEILYAITTDSAPDYMPATGGATVVSQEFAVYIGVTNAASVVAQIDSGALATMGYVEHYVKTIHDNDRNAHLNMVGATSGVNGQRGMVPAPAKGQQDMPLLGSADFKVLPVAGGGTGASTVAGARNALGLGNTAGAVPIANGGTGATTAGQARTNLGLATVANTGSYNDLSNKPTIPSAYTHPNSGVTAGTYRSVTVNTQGHVTKGENPTKLSTAGLLDLIYPVGSLYWSKKSTSPATLFGGTWTQIKDKFILAAGDAYAQGATGGSATVTLTTAQLPAHNHSGSAQSNGSHSHGASSNSTGEHTHRLYIRTTNDGDFGLTYYGGTVGYQNKWMESAGSHSHTITVNSGGDHTHTLTINNTGSGEGHENMPPYVTYYCWERTA